MILLPAHGAKLAEGNSACATRRERGYIFLLFFISQVRTGCLWVAALNWTCLSSPDLGESWHLDGIV